MHCPILSTAIVIIDRSINSERKGSIVKKSVKDLREARDGYLLIAPLLVGCMIFYFVPFFLVISYSLSKGSGNTRRWIGLENYMDMLDNHIFRLAYGNTLKFLVIALPLILIVSYAIALLLKNQVQKHAALKSVLLLPYIMPVVGTVLLVELLFAEGGMINEALYSLGLPIEDLLDSNFAFWIVVLLYLWKNAGYSVILLLAGLVTIPEDHYDAASLDGAGGWQKFLYITTPQMWYSVFFAMVFSLINAFKCFREIFLIGGTHPHDSIYMLQHFINNSFENLNYPKLAVASMLLLIVITAVFTVCYRWVMRKEDFRG